MDPVFLGQSQNLGTVETTGGGKVKILDDRGLAEVGHPHPASLFLILTKSPFLVQQQAQPFLERELSVGGIFHLLAEPIAHPGEFQRTKLIEDRLD